MNRIRLHWKKLSERRGKALIPYVTPEFPIEGATVDLVLALEAAGATAVEIGIPYSDPLADGPVIQHASQTALRNGAVPARVLGIVKAIRVRSSIPILLMGYVNPILRLGIEPFLSKAVEAGVDGLIIPDLPPGESSLVHSCARERGISMVYLIAPTTNDDRMREIDDLSTDFTYCVSITGVTGASSRFSDTRTLEGFMQRVRAATAKPCVVGFGISTREDVRRVWEIADGAVVGSQLLREIADCTTVDEVVAKGRSYIQGLCAPEPLTGAMA